MLSDRAYMRDSYPPASRSALVWVISATIAGFILANIFERWLAVSPAFIDIFSLSVGGVKKGFVWQLLSYGFVHAPGNLMDVLIFGFNLLCLYLLGRDIENLIGSRRFLWLYCGGFVLGGLAWFATNYRFGSGMVMGAWPGIIALFTLFACLNANQRIPLLVFFVFPITLKPKYLIWTALIFDVLGFVLYELPRGHGPFGYHSTHLGGMLAGFLYFRLVHEREWRTPDGLTEIELPKWLKKKQAAAAPAQPVYKVNLDREGLRAEVDRILDKINSEGFQSLTDDEKRLLDDAKDLLSRH